MTRHAQRGLYLIVGGFLFFLLPACNTGPGSSIQGTWINPDKPYLTLHITAHQMVTFGGAINVKSDYKIVNVTGNEITIEVKSPDAPAWANGYLQVLTVADDTLEIKNNIFFSGSWTRK